MSKVTAYYHIVFCTKYRGKTIPMHLREDLYRVIWKIITDKRSRLIRIGGVEDHVHMLINLHPSVALSELMQAVKGGSSTWMSNDPRFIRFTGWAADYYAGTISPEVRDNVIEYIKGQEQHHCRKSLKDELVELYQLAGLKYYDRDMV